MPDLSLAYCGRREVIVAATGAGARRLYDSDGEVSGAEIPKVCDNDADAGGGGRQRRSKKPKEGGGHLIIDSEDKEGCWVHVCMYAQT